MNKHFVFKKLSVFATFFVMIFIFNSPVVAQMNNEKSMSEHINNADSAKGITIHQEIYFKVSPQQVYDALLSSKEFSDCTKKSFNNFTAMSANIDSAVGGAFQYLTGIL
jgi:hypothetical protein